MTEREWVVLIRLLFRGDAFSRKHYVVSHKENRK